MTVEDLRDRVFKAFIVVLIASAIFSLIVARFAVQNDKETLCQYIIPEAQTLTCEEDHGPN